MQLTDLSDKYKRINEYFDQKYPNFTKDFRLLARLGKITEELGELNSAVHSELGIQRQEKQDLHMTENLELEWADVFNTVMLFGLVAGIDAESVLEKRLQQIFDRYHIIESENLSVKQPNNNHTAANPVGHFMVATGSVIVNEKTRKILITQRAQNQDWHPNEWEITYGRIDQHEDPEQGLKREVLEELGLTDLAVQRVLRVWHMYRGPKKMENDLIGITFVCTTASENVRLSHEHQAYKWVTPQDALQLISIDGARKDVETYIAEGNNACKQ